MRRLAIAAVLCSLGVLAYLYVSEGPARVHWVTIPTHSVFLLGLSVAAWLGRLPWKQRFAVCVGWTAAAASLGTYVDSWVIAVLNPLHPIYFGMAFLAFALEGSLLLLCSRLVDRAWDFVRVHYER
jgi:hypothetical protein